MIATTVLPAVQNRDRVTLVVVLIWGFSMIEAIGRFDEERGENVITSVCVLVFILVLYLLASSE